MQSATIDAWQEPNTRAIMLALANLVEIYARLVRCFGRILLERPVPRSSHADASLTSGAGARCPAAGRTGIGGATC